MKVQGQEEEDISTHRFIGSTHGYLLFFTDRGRVYREKIYNLPEADRTAQGSYARNILPLKDEEQISSVLPINDLNEQGYFVFATRRGMVKKTLINDYANLNKGGFTAIKLVDDELVAVCRSEGYSLLLLCEPL